MSIQTTPIVFLSYSHHDKRVARRLYRQLSAHGVKVLFNERDLQIGGPLTASIRTKIQSADTLIVIASQASTRSEWVAKELEFARAHGRKVIPLFIDPASEHERFRDCLGLDCTQPQAFATVVHDLLSSLFLADTNRAAKAQGFHLSRVVNGAQAGALLRQGHIAGSSRRRNDAFAHFGSAETVVCSVALWPHTSFCGAHFSIVNDRRYGTNRGACGRYVA